MAVRGRRSPLVFGRRTDGRINAWESLPTERKYLTLLRTDLHRSTDLLQGLELEDAINRLAPALAAMRAAVHAHNGIVYREMGDGLIAAFGAPIADDLHAVMGCLAALDVLSRVEAVGDPLFRVRIGVHSGQVVAGSRRLDLGTGYELDGPALIMAERLQSVALPGQILASSECRKLAEGYISFGSELVHTLKGFAQPVTVHTVERAGEVSKWRVTASRRGASFVGRLTEMQRLRTLAAVAEEGGGGACVAVLGEPGVGKSRLAREFVATLRDRNWQTIEAECSPIVGQAPFALLKALLVDMAAALEPHTLEKLESQLSLRERAALKILLHGADPDKLPAWAAVPPRARNRAIVGATRSIAAHRLRDGPCVGLIEDLQWADEASTAAIDVLLALTETQGLVVLATHRGSAPPQWFARRMSLQLALGPLPGSAGRELLDHLMGSNSRLDTLKQRILQHTGAMPLFIEEVCRGLVERGIVAGAWGALEVMDQVDELGVPLTVQGMIASRVDRLSRREKHLLQVASAIGPRSSNQLLKSVAALPDAAFQSGLNTLFDGAMLVPALTTSDGMLSGYSASYAFPHELVRQVAYDAILNSERTTLHKRILAQLEQAAGGQSGPELAGALVHHAMLSLQWARAAEYATSIARQSFAQSALPDALRYYECAMQAVDRLPHSPVREAQAIDLRIEARSAYANIGKVRGWLDLATQAESRAAIAGDTGRRVAALAVRAAALNFCGTAAEAVEAGHQAVTEAGRSGNPGWLAYAKYGLGQAYYIAGRYREAVETLESAQQQFFEFAQPPLGGSPLQAGLLCCMMTCLSHVALGNDALAGVAQQRADDLARRENRPLAVIAATLSRGALLLNTDEPKAAEAALSVALAQARQHEVNLFVPIIAYHYGLALTLLGARTDAWEAFDLAHVEAETLGHFSLSLRGQVYKALCESIAPGRRKSALSAVKAIGRRAKQQSYAPVELDAMIVEAALLRAMNKRDDAAACDAAASLICEQLGAVGASRSAHRVTAVLHGVPSGSAGLV